MFQGLPRGSSEVIDRQSVSTSIFRTICNVSRKINGVTLVMDEQNTLSLCPGEGPGNLFPVRIRCVSVLYTHPHMSPRISTRLDVYSDMYVKDKVLLCVMKCKTSSKTLK